MNKLNRSFALLATVATFSLVGCGQDNIAGPANLDHQHDSALSIEAKVLSGKAIFQQCEANAIGTLSLGEIVSLTPYLEGTKTQESMTLSEAVTMTPIIVKFRTAFNAEVASLSLGDVVRMTSYMTRNGKNRFPYPELASGGGAAV